jgi:hypothetical protein
MHSYRITFIHLQPLHERGVFHFASQTPRPKRQTHHKPPSQRSRTCRSIPFARRSTGRDDPLCGWIAAQTAMLMQSLSLSNHLCHNEKKRKTKQEPEGRRVTACRAHASVSNVASRYEANTRFGLWAPLPSPSAMPSLHSIDRSVFDLGASIGPLCIRCCVAGTTFFTTS